MAVVVEMTLSSTPLAILAPVWVEVIVPDNSAALLVLRIRVRLAGVGIPKARPPAKVKTVPDELTMAPSALWPELTPLSLRPPQCCRRSCRPGCLPSR